MKKLVYIVLMLAVAFAFVGCDGVGASSRNYVTYTMAPEMYAHVQLGYNEGEFGPITITEGKLKNGRTNKAVYLVGLSGTEFVDGQATGLITDLLSGFCLDNDYVKAIITAITENVPAGSNLVLTGHSLGGMVAQQVAANSTIKDNYNVLNTLTFGSPLLAAGSREGQTIRLGDTGDVVPYLSGSMFNNTLWAILGLNRENGHYGLNLEAAHVQSYAREDLWGKYDAIGKKNGSAKIILDMDTLTYYRANTDLLP
ncbi:MAG: hypothetical protein K5839_03845 [Treponemataceae bacterium]|nr:hypothetical protein [Treponemataceae bacterium]